jgi:hypothetical protein
VTSPGTGNLLVTQYLNHLPYCTINTNTHTHKYNIIYIHIYIYTRLIYLFITERAPAEQSVQRLVAGWTTEGSASESTLGQGFSHLCMVQPGSEALPTSYPMGTGSSIPGGKVGRVKLPTHLQLGRRSRKRGSIHPLPQHDFMP